MMTRLPLLLKYWLKYWRIISFRGLYATLAVRFHTESYGMIQIVWLFRHLCSFHDDLRHFWWIRLCILYNKHILFLKVQLFIGKTWFRNLDLQIDDEQCLKMKLKNVYYQNFMSMLFGKLFPFSESRTYCDGYCS